MTHGDLPETPHDTAVEIVSCGALPPAEFDALLAGADLVITDNAVSSTSGKAVCMLTPVARLRNSRRLIEIVDEAEPGVRAIALAMERTRPGAVFPFEVFPLWNAEDLERLGLFRENSIGHAVEPIEMFQGGCSRRVLQDLLTDCAGASRSTWTGSPCCRGRVRSWRR
jgi:hypothetical protein